MRPCTEAPLEGGYETAGGRVTTAQPDRRAARARATGPVGGVLGRELVKGLNEYV